MAENLTQITDSDAVITQALTPTLSKIERPTPTSERTIVFIVAAAFMWVAGIILLMVFARPSQGAMLYIGIALLVLVAMPLLIALSFASPWLGSERISAGPSGVSLEVNNSINSGEKP